MVDGTSSGVDHKGGGGSHLVLQLITMLQLQLNCNSEDLLDDQAVENTSVVLNFTTLVVQEDVTQGSIFPGAQGHN